MKKSISDNIDKGAAETKKIVRKLITKVRTVLWARTKARLSLNFRACTTWFNTLTRRKIRLRFNLEEKTSWIWNKRNQIPLMPPLLFLTISTLSPLKFRSPVVVR